MKKKDKQHTAFDDAKEHSRRSFIQLWDIINKYRKPIPKGSSKQPVHESRRPQQSWPSLKILRIIPGLLVLLFGLSFLWDFNNFSFRLFDHLFNVEGLLRILSVSGLIGFGTNWLAITMLFKPTQKRPLLGQGLIPAHKERIAVRLSHAVADDLINPEIIKQKIHDSDIISRYRKYSTRYIKTIIDHPGFRRDLKAWTLRYVEDMMANPQVRSAIAKKILIQIEQSVQKTTLEKAALRAYTFVKGQKMQHIIEEALTQLPASVEDGLDRFDVLLDDLPDHIEDRSDKIEQTVTSLLYFIVNQLDVQKLVEEKINQYDEQRISTLIKNTTNEQLQYIQYLGAILGVIGGLLIWEPFYCLILLFILGAVIFGFDYLLMKYN